MLKTLFMDAYHCTRAWKGLFHLRRWKCTLQTRKCHLGLAGGEGSPRALSRTHFTAENVQTTSNVEIFKVKEPVTSLDAKGTLVPKANYALVKAALQMGA